MHALRRLFTGYEAVLCTAIMDLRRISPLYDSSCRFELLAVILDVRRASSDLLHEQG